MELYGVIYVTILYFAHQAKAAAVTPPTGTTAWPEICRVFSKYRDCTDSTFRVACSYLCDSIESGCTRRNLIYIPSKGSCYGMTVTGQNLWPFALDSCLWYGGTLATLKDASDVEVIEYLVAASGNSNSKFLVGALNVGKGDVWVHVDGTEVDDLFWSSSKPTSSGFLCMLSDKTQSYKQGSDNCGQNRAFICEAS